MLLQSVILILLQSNSIDRRWTSHLPSLSLLSISVAVALVAFAAADASALCCARVHAFYSNVVVQQQLNERGGRTSPSPSLLRISAVAVSIAVAVADACARFPARVLY